MSTGSLGTMNISDGVGEVVFDLLAHAEDADYSWYAEAILRRQADGALFYVSDSGCSCDGFGYYLTVADLQPIGSVEAGFRLASHRADLQRSYDQKEAIYR